MVPKFCTVYGAMTAYSSRRSVISALRFAHDQKNPDKTEPEGDVNKTRSGDESQNNRTTQGDKTDGFRFGRVWADIAMLSGAYTGVLLYDFEQYSLLAPQYLSYNRLDMTETTFAGFSILAAYATIKAIRQREKETPVFAAIFKFIAAPFGHITGYLLTQLSDIRDILPSEAYSGAFVLTSLLGITAASITMFTGTGKSIGEYVANKFGEYSFKKAHKNPPEEPDKI